MSKKANNSLPVFRTYNADEMPDNVQQVDIVEAHQIINNIPVKIDPKQIKVSRATQTIKLNLSISTTKKSENEV